MKRMIKKAIAIVLTIAITGTSNGIGSLSEVRAESTGLQTNEQVNLTESTNNGLEKVKELKSKRTENSNTYLMSDGSKQLEMYFEDVRFEENGELVDYDSSLVSNTKNVTVGTDTLSKNDYAYVNKAGDCKHYIPESLDEDTPIVLKKDSNYIKFSPIIESEESESETETETAADTGSDNLCLSDAILTDDGNIEYSVGDVTYQYISNNKGIKENVIFDSEPTDYDISYTFNLNNAYLEYSADTRQIFIKDSSNGDITAYISAPFLNDNSEMNFNFDIGTDVEEADGKWIVTYSLPQEYFEDDEISYPVVLDPTIAWNTASDIDIRYTLKVGGSGGSVMDSSNRFMIANLDNGPGTGTEGYGAQANVRFKNLHNIIAGKYIAFSYCNFIEESKSGTPLLSVYPIIEDWNYLTTNWNNRPDVSSESICDIDMTIDNGTVSLWLTDWVRKLSSGEIDNDYGIAFYPQEDSDPFWLYFYGLSAAMGPNGQGRKPMLIVNYDDGENINASYDATFTINSEYDSENEEIDLLWDEYNSDIDRYDLYVRNDDDSHFKYAGCTTTNEISYDTYTDVDNYDFRVVAVEAGSFAPYGPYDTQYLSNILSLEKNVYTYLDEFEQEQTEITYEPCMKDTDGDELEDGNEIWDFKTYWNAETLESTPEEPIYELDTDGDGFPDSYEVFMLGTDPAIANTVDEDSDGDNWTDLREYQEGTDPWLADSDFDGTNDRGDSTPRKTNDYTRQTAAAQATVHLGLYDKQYSETIDGVTYTYIINIYRGNIKKIVADYGSIYLNKTIKNFYDERGNNTAIVESYDDTYDPNHTQTICITYTYDSDNNLTFICDQRTKYTMTYNNDGEMSSLKVGNQSLMTYADTELVNNAGNDGDISNIQMGGIIDQNEHTDTYGNGQVVRTVTTTYKVAENDTTSVATTTELYYNSDISPTYISYFNYKGELKKFEDYSEDVLNPIEWNYTYSENGSLLTRSDNFTKSVQTTEDENTGVISTSTSYGFKNLKNISTTYTSIISSETETETNVAGEDVTISIVNETLHNNDTVQIEMSEDTASEKIHSSVFNIDLINSIYEKIDTTHTSYDIDLSGTTDDKSFDYTYDLTGNITKIKENNIVKYEYGYDAHGRLNLEKDYVLYKEYDYDYNTNGNVYGKTEYPINANGVRTSNDGTTVYYTYENSNWPDQLTTYAGQTITYDNSGNPLTYKDGMSFTWERGRQLSQITMSDNSTVSYLYNENGLRTYKETTDSETVYEWDGNRLIREVVTDKSTNKKTDIWYLYDGAGDIIGFEVSYFPTSEILANIRYYYEKNLQGDIIGILTMHGDKVVSYTYDAWGNVTSSSCSTGSEMVYSLNHIKYRGYYQDDETGFYYLQSRYYDSEVGRFINADDVQYLGVSGTVWGYILYSYCENNPILYTDHSGQIALITCVIIGVVAGAVIGAVASKMVYGKVNGWWVLGGAVIGGTLGYFGGAFFGATGIKAGTLAKSVSMSKVRWLGRIGEKISGWTKNTQRIASLTASASYRIPDYLNHAEKVIGDVKNVKYLSYTKQLQDFMLYAEQNKYTYILMIRQNTQLSSTIKELVDKGKIVIMYLKK